MSDLINKIKEVIGKTDFSFLQKDENSPVKLDFIRLKNGQTAGFTDNERVHLLSNAQKKLEEAGLVANIRLTYRTVVNGVEVYKPWPCIWVNNPQNQSSSPLDKLKEERDKALAELEKLRNQTALPLEDSEDIPF